MQVYLTRKLSTVSNLPHFIVMQRSESIVNLQVFKPTGIFKDE
jgi:hypothetical protein